MDFSHQREPPFLRLRNVSHAYGRKSVLQDVSLEVHKSEVLALLGPSGSGKSTLLSVLAGIVTPTRGEFILDGQDISRLSAEMRGLGMVFQDFALWPHMTVAENVGFPLRVRKLPRAEITRRTEEALIRVGLEGFKSRRPQQLSGGQQQRVALARAVVAETRLLLLDEPLSALDPATRASVRGELADILRKLNLTTIIVTHDREEAFELADRIAILVDGEIQQHARPEDAYERPANLAVARFMGTNLLSAQIRSDGKAELNNGARSVLQLNHPFSEGFANLAIVPEQSRVVETRARGVNVLPAQVLRTQYRGGEYRVQAKIGNAEFGQTIEARSKEPPGGNSVLIQLPAEAIHIIQKPPLAPLPSAARQSPTNCNLTKLQEELA